MRASGLIDKDRTFLISKPDSNSSADQPLDKPLGLADVYAISTGAMFASGFFLLPGVAAEEAGPAVVLVYGMASLLMIPTAFAIAELSTTLPRAGGPYYFIDRSFGPAMGTVGGLGVWLVLVLKSAFALVGMGAYLGLVLDFPIEPIAVLTTVAFAALNIFGAKQSARLQQVLVLALLVWMLLYVFSGLWGIGQEGFAANAERQFNPWLPFGAAALPATIGMVFVFALLNLTVIVMRESKLESYVPEFRTPLYPAMPLVGFHRSIALIIVLGWFYILFLLVVISASVLWYC